MQHLFVGGQFHIDDMTITSDEKPVCLVAAADAVSLPGQAILKEQRIGGTTRTRLKAY